MAQMIETVLDPPARTVAEPLKSEKINTRQGESLYAPRPDISHIITEDDEPVDNIFSAKQQRLLVESIHSGWRIDQPFFADSNVGIFASLRESPLVPDVFLSLGVTPPQEDAWKKEHRSYFLWEYGKPPEVVIEVVSNREGREVSRKLSAYARLGILYYVIYDPAKRVQNLPLIVYELVVGKYVARPDYHLPEIGLSLSLWEHEYEGMPDVWLRWAELNGTLIPTGAELADEQRQLAEEQRQLAEEQRQLAEQERQIAKEQRERAEKLAARLRELGIDPAEIQ